MPLDSINTLTLAAQERMFRLAKFNHGLSLKVISLETGIKYETLRSYAGNKDQHSIMPVSAVNALAICIPDYLLSLLFEVSDRQLIEVEQDDEPDFDAIGDQAGDLEAEVRRARHPQSPGGTNIVPIEQNAIRAKRLRLAGRAA